jgi:hypothetical protein
VFQFANTWNINGGSSVYRTLEETLLKNTFLVLDGDNMPNVYRNSMVVAIDPGEVTLA